jgi:uncharacterized membrane protein
VTARIRSYVRSVGETFWLVPGAMVLLGIAAALAMVALDRSGSIPAWVLASRWLYDGGGTGARTLLGAVASSTIGVAGTVFSITIAALSLAAGQMGPRLLRNFVRDRGNQVTLGVYLGTFSYALIVLRSVRTQEEGPFVPHLALSVGILLAFVCVGTLVYFVGHMAGRINVDTVIELVSEELATACKRLTLEQPQPDAPDDSFWTGAERVTDPRRGYLQQLDTAALADWAERHGTAIRLYVRPGDYVFPGTKIAVVKPMVDGVDAAIASATALGAQRVSDEDLEYAVRQLVEVAVRALSPGINDPNTAMSVLDRLGAALCELAPRYLASGVVWRRDRVVLVVPRIDYGGLVDTMFHMIRQNGSRSPAVLIRLLEVLTAVADCETDATRLGELRRHAELVLRAAQENITSQSDLADVRTRHERFCSVRDPGARTATRYFS